MVAKRARLTQLRGLIEQHGTLYRAASKQPRVGEVRGRGIALVASFGPDVWVVRHYRRGGSVARLLGDRYVRTGTPRPLHELQVSSAARQRGISTPEVSAAAWYDVGAFRRCDIAVTYIPRASDLAAILAGGDTTVQVTRAAGLIRDFLRKGLLHRDLNIKNILISADQAYVLDLDRCELVEALTAVQVTRMRERFLRSLAKWERQSNRALAAATRRILTEAFDV